MSPSDFKFFFMAKVELCILMISAACKMTEEVGLQWQRPGEDNERLCSFRDHHEREVSTVYPCHYNYNSTVVPCFESMPAKLL